MNDINTEALNPCPFCGGQPEIFGKMDTGYKIVHRCIGDSCSQISFTRNERAGAIDAWNKRASPPAVTDISGKEGERGINMPPLEIIQAARQVHYWFASRNIKQWKLLDIQSRDCDSLSQPPAVQVPEGWKLVPAKPTAEWREKLDDIGYSHRTVIRDVLAAAPSPAAVRVEEGLTIENVPIGTKAPAIGGGHWIKVERGWKWWCGNTLPRPGGDWTGKLIAPPAAPSPAAKKEGADE